jgi:hypothetical protein
LYESTAVILSFGESALLKFHRTPESHSNSNDIGTNSVNVNDDFNRFSVFLPSNSLLMFGNKLYNEYQHGISVGAEFQISSEKNDLCINSEFLNLDNECINFIRKKKRFSLTFRKLKNVLKTLDEFGLSASAEERSEFERRKRWWLNAISDQNNI